MAAKKALIIVENSYPPPDVRVWHEAQTLRDHGWEVAVICPTFDAVAPASFGQTEDLHGVTLYRFPLACASMGVFGYLREYAAAFVAIARLARRVWRNGRFDVLHLCNPPDIFFPIALIVRLRGGRVVFDHHDLVPELVTSRYNGLAGRVLHGIARLSEFLTYQSAHTVIATNDSYRQIAITRGGKPPARVFTVRNGPRLDQFVPVPPDPALKRGCRYMAAYAGVMGHEDGLQDLLATIRYIALDQGRRDIRFVLLGDGALRPAIAAAVQQEGLDDIVELPGMIHDKLLLRRYLSTADVCLSPEPLNPLNARSTFVKVAEYLALGKPVVAYDLPETRVTAHEAAVYVPPGDARAFGQGIITLLDDAARRQRMGDIGRQRVMTSLAWEHQQPHLLRAYEAALDGKRKPSEAPSGAAIPTCQLLSLDQMSEETITLQMPIHRRLKLMIKRRLSLKQRKIWKARVRRITDWWGRLRGKTINRQPEIPTVTDEFHPGDLARVRSLEEIEKTLDRGRRLKGCAFMPEMEPYCGTTQRVFKPVRRFLDERDYRVKKTSGIIILEGVFCEGAAEFGPCDRGCFFFWRQEWLERVEQADSPSVE
jgi:glycosyltransferase involved in cell wall biosynthesis